MTSIDLHVWIIAARPKTLPAAVSPVMVGSASAAAGCSFSLLPALAALFGAFFLQVGVNLANDYFDYVRGVDTCDRLGPPRVTQSGLLKPSEVFAGMLASFALASAAGFYLIKVAGWPVLAIGLSSIAAAVCYSAGPFPLASHGLGDLSAFVFFGPIAVCGTHYVQALKLGLMPMLLSIPVGLLVCAILVVNNLRDIPTDSRAGKKTLAVMFGAGFTRAEFSLLVFFSYICVLAQVMCAEGPPGMLLVFLTLPEAVLLTSKVVRLSGTALNACLARSARLTFFFSLALSLGLVGSRFIG